MWLFSNSYIFFCAIQNVKPILFYICHLAINIVLPVSPNSYSSNMLISLVLCDNNIPRMSSKGCGVPDTMNKTTIYGPRGHWPCQAVWR